MAGREAIKPWLKSSEEDISKDFEIIRNIVLKNLTSIKREPKKFRKEFRLKS